jgi:hypothetical protein
MQAMTHYDGTTSRNDEIKKRFNLSTPASWSRYNKLACKALGLPVKANAADGKRTPAENVAIIEWLDDYFAQPKKVKATPKPKPKTRNKVKRESRFNQFTRISFNVTGNAQRQHISLEPEFIRALDLIAPANRNQWLSDTTADYIAKNGIESTTRIIKSAIVNELLKRATGG